MRCCQLFLEKLDDVKVGRGDILVVLLDLGILLLVLQGALLDFRVFASLDHLNTFLAPFFHLGAEVDHAFLVFELDLVAESFVVVAHLGHTFVEGTMQGVRILLLTGVLLFFRHFQAP